jgi:hypothetical protein
MILRLFFAISRRRSGLIPLESRDVAGGVTADVGVGDREDLGAVHDAHPLPAPIGLPDAGRRQAEVAAKAELGPRRNSVFFTPVGSALEATNHSSATALSMKLTGSGMSQQSYALRTRIF